MKNESSSPGLITVLGPAAAAAMPRPPDNLATPVLERHGVEVEFYAPHGVDPQTPHTRDELYVIAQGSGWFTLREERLPFATGDLIFVPAGAAHRFERFSDDFAAWVVFFGPSQ